MSNMIAGSLRKMAQACPSDLGPEGVSASARIMTAQGERKLGDIRPGDRIISRSRGMICVADIEHFTCDVPPVALAPHALGNGRPSDLVHVSPAQKILLRDWRARLLYGSLSALAPAAALIDQGYITRTPRLKGMEMVRLFFKTPEILYVGMLECAFEPCAKAKVA